jgi:hypothetical protein
VSPRRHTLRSVLLLPILGSAWGGPSGLGAFQLPDSVVLHDEARDLLLETLARVGLALPGDLWVLGQRAFYLAEAGAPEGVLPFLDPCPVSPAWWCDALAGYALHRAHRFEGAEEAFARALGDMPPEVASRWTDPRPVMDRSGRELLDRAADRRDLASRFWALSDPLFLVPGNDRWTEHLARRVEAFIREEARNGYGLRWGEDLAESLVRYGTEAGWERRRPGPGEMASSGGGVGQHHPELRSHVAPGAALSDLPATGESEWNPGDRVMPRSGYAPSYAPVLLPAAGVIRRVPRGDHVILIALLDLPTDTSYHSAHGHPALPRPPAAEAGGATEFGFFATDSAGTIVARDGGSEGRLRLRLPPGRYLLSGEVWAPDSLRAGRLRRGFEWTPVPPDLPVVSDLLLGAPLAAVPEDLDALIPLLRTGDEATLFVPGEALTVAWELHGLGRDGAEEVRYELVFQGTSGGFFRRAGRALGLVGDPWRQELAWTESGPDAPGPFLRTARLTLPPDMDPGEYVLRLKVELEGREAMVTEQAVRVAVGADRMHTAR